MVDPVCSDPVIFCSDTEIPIFFLPWFLHWLIKTSWFSLFLLGVGVFLLVVAAGGGLLLPHGRVLPSGRGEQLVVRAALDDLTLLQHEDEVRVRHRRQPVRHHDRRPVPAYRAQRILCGKEL